MYDELIKRLRERSVFLFPHHGESRSYDADLMHEAADAIEGLSHAVDQMTEWRKNRWIPVTERLPEKTNHYLVYVKCGCDGELVSAWEQVAWFCEKFYWEHLHGDDVFKETVTYWMELPPPPKEEV